MEANGDTAALTSGFMLLRRLLPCLQHLQLGVPAERYPCRAKTFWPQRVRLQHYLCIFGYTRSSGIRLFPRSLQSPVLLNYS